MKKILYFIYAVVLAYVIFLNFIDYSCAVSKELELNKVEVTINKPDEKSNKEFIFDLDDVTEKLDMDIMYLITDVSGEKIRKDYFITAHTPDFLKFDNIDVKEIFNRYEGITNTNAGEDYFRIKYSTLIYNIYIFDITKAEKYNLESCNFYINADFENRFISSLIDEGYEVFKTNGTAVKSAYLTLRTMILPIMILLTSMIFYSLNKRKEGVIKLLGGYSKILVAIENSYKCHIAMLTMCIIFVCLSTIGTMYVYNTNPVEYICFSIKALTPFILFVIISVFVINTATVVTLQTYHMKGKNENYDLYIVSYILKIAFSFLTIIVISNILLEIRNINDIHRSNVRISNELKSYITLPVNSSSTSINDVNQLEFNSRLDMFYDKTVDMYNGVLINTRNYRIGNLDTDDSLAEAYGQARITVNENYLILNIIHDVNGETITERNINPHMFNLLLPENQRGNEQNIIDSYAYSYDIDKKEINSIFYKQNEEINTFNPYSGRENGGIIYNPIIEIYDTEYLKNQMLNYVSGQYYLLKIDSHDPYTELLPILKEYKLDGIILYTTNISNVFDNSIANIKERLNHDVINALLYIISITLLIIYNCTIYFQIYGKKIVYKRLSGFGFIEVHIVPFVLLFIQYMVFALMNGAFTISSKGVVLCIFIFEVCVFAYNTYKSQKKYILKLIKGGAE
ncbi:MAG: hypothetical protein E7255_14985 [Lachnospiraceae bacterium]|jgi:hypothetical protein|nr:hypothetical protein [Lachnospiraceae bacterium]